MRAVASELHAGEEVWDGGDLRPRGALVIEVRSPGGRAHAEGERQGAAAERHLTIDSVAGQGLDIEDAHPEC